MVTIGGMLNIGIGLVLHTVNRRFQEMEHFEFLTPKFDQQEGVEKK